MNLYEFSDKFATATQKLSAEERQLLLTAFQKVAAQLDAEKAAAQSFSPDVTETDVPDGMTDRLKRLKANYMKQVPSITTYRARAITKIARENPGMPEGNAAG